jgi:hypothetical protein
MMTVAAILFCLVLLFVLLSAYNWWMNQGPFGWFMAFNLLDSIGCLLSIIGQLIVSLFNSDS